MTEVNRHKRSMGQDGGARKRFKTHSEPKKVTQVHQLLHEPLIDRAAFPERFTEAAPPEIMDQRYEEYLRLYKHKKAKVFAEAQRKHAWFQALFSPEAMQAQCQLRKQRIEENKDELLEACLSLSHSFDCNDEEIVSQIQSFASVLPGKAPSIQHEDEPSDLTSGPVPLPEPYEGGILALRDVPEQCDEPTISAVFADMEGYVDTQLGTVDPRRRFTKSGWARFATRDHAEIAASLVLKQSDWKARFGAMTATVHTPSPLAGAKVVRVVPPYSQVQDRLKADLQQSQALAKHLDEELGLEGCFTRVEQAIVALESKRALDMVIYYLRAFHLYDYYSGRQFTSVTRLDTFCALHVRAAITTGAIPLGAEYMRELDRVVERRLALHLHRLEEIRAEGKAALEKRACAKFYVVVAGKDGVDIYQCKVCNKLFKDVVYIEKHLLTKHPEVIAASLPANPGDLDVLVYIVQSEPFWYDARTRSATSSDPTAAQKPTARAFQRSAPVYRDPDRLDVVVSPLPNADALYAARPTVDYNDI